MCKKISLCRTFSYFVSLNSVSLFPNRDGLHMAKGVMATLQELLQKDGGMTKEAASAKIAAMLRENTYVQDIWS